MLMVFALTFLLLALYTGLAKSSLLHAGNLANLHSPFMMVGFFGTLISLERAVALRKGWVYALTALIPVGCALGVLLRIAFLLSAIGGLAMLFIFATFIRRYSLKVHWVIMAIGAASFVIATALYALGTPHERVYPLWLSFLVLTIIGERIELSGHFSTGGIWNAFALLNSTLLLLGATLQRAELLGLSLLSFVLWAVFKDVAFRNLRIGGMTGYVSSAIVLGYVWMSVSAILWTLGINYDLALHGLSLGFVFGMVFAHAPLIAPAVLERRVRFSPLLYAPLLLLHTSLVVRVFFLKPGALLGVLSVLLFLSVMRLKVLH